MRRVKTVFYITEDEAEILEVMIAVRVLSTDQIRRVWYQGKCDGAVWKRVRIMRERRLLYRFPVRVDAQTVWTYTARAIEVMKNRVPFVIPKNWWFSEFTLRHQLMIAEVW